MKQAVTYHQLKPVYDEYRQSRDKGKFLWGHEGEIILFEATWELKELGAVPVPSMEGMRKELTALTERKEALLAGYRAARSEAQDYEIIKQNIETLLSTPKEQIRELSNVL